MQMAGSAPDYYKILGVEKNADDKTIKKAFRKLAQKHHPDAGGSEEKFKEINEAYEVLSDPEKRQVYDQFGVSGGANPFAGGANPFQGQSFSFNIEDLFSGVSGWSDILNKMRGGEGAFGTNWDFRNNGGQGFGRRHVPDVKADLDITAREAYVGVKKQFSVGIPGSGTINLNIPAGTKDETKFRIKGQGQNGGDLIVVVKIVSDNVFKMEDGKLIIETPITIGEACLGGKIEVLTPDNKKIRIKVPAGVQNGTKMKVKDMFVRLNIVIPKSLNKNQKKALEKYCEIEDKGVRQW